MSQTQSDELRALLHALADRLARAVVAPPRDESATASGPDDPSQPSLDSLALRAAIDALAAGNLSFRPSSSVSPGLARAIDQAFERVRTLIRAARATSVGSETRADAIVESVERAATAGNHQRISLDRAADELRPLAARLEQLSSESSALAHDADRVALLALNTGIEGLRVGGEVARALGALGDEVRRLALEMGSRARETREGLQSSLELSRRAAAGIDEARSALRSIADEVTRAAAAAEAIRSADDALRACSEGFRVMDPESAAVVSALDRAADGLREDLARAKAACVQDDASGEEIRAALARLRHVLREEG
jgi:methyl-accepting chemotaxis protein